jgi:hypothetical protein
MDLFRKASEVECIVPVVVRRMFGCPEQPLAFQKTSVMEWIDAKLKTDAPLAMQVGALLREMRLGQDLARHRPRVSSRRLDGSLCRERRRAR